VLRQIFPVQVQTLIHFQQKLQESAPPFSAHGPQTLSWLTKANIELFKNQITPLSFMVGSSQSSVLTQPKKGLYSSCKNRPGVCKKLSGSLKLVSWSSIRTTRDLTNPYDATAQSTTASFSSCQPERSFHHSPSFDWSADADAGDIVPI